MIVHATVPDVVTRFSMFQKSPARSSAVRLLGSETRYPKPLYPSNLRPEDQGVNTGPSFHVKLWRMLIIFAIGTALPLIGITLGEATGIPAQMTGSDTFGMLISDVPHLRPSNREPKTLPPKAPLQQSVSSGSKKITSTSATAKIDHSKGSCRVAFQTMVDSTKFAEVEKSVVEYNLPLKKLSGLCDTAAPIVVDIAMPSRQEYERSVGSGWKAYFDKNLRRRTVPRSDGIRLRFGDIVDSNNYTYSYQAILKPLEPAPPVA